MDSRSHDPGASAPPVLLPKHTIFLSYSRQEKAFVQELNQALLRVHHSPFFDENEESLPKGRRYPELIFEAAKHCRVAVIVLSPGYLKSKWPMLELVAFHKSMKEGDPITLLPIFYKLTPDQIDSLEWMESWVELFKRDKELVQNCKQVRDCKHALHALKAINGQIDSLEWMESWTALLKQDEELVQNCKEVEDCKRAVHALKAINGLVFEKYGNNHVKYKEDVVAKICKLLPPPLHFDTSDLQGCDRLCKHLSGMFNIAELFQEHDGTHYLGIYGICGSGKTRLCQAMCNKFFDKYKGKYCIVKLQFATPCNSQEKREERLKSAIEQLVGVNQNISCIYSEEIQLRKYLKDQVENKRVFLVVENVSQISLEEAEFYLKAGYGPGSRVLVTSRNKSFLERIFQGQQCTDFIQPIPVLNDIEAAQLVLAHGAPNRSIIDLNNLELEIVKDYCADFCPNEQYHPSSLKALGSYLRRTVVGDKIASWKDRLKGGYSKMGYISPKPISWESFQKSIEAKDLYHHVLQQYDDLSPTAKLVFLDLALSPESKLNTYTDLHPSWQSDECSNYTNVVTYISNLHDLCPEQVVMKVEELQVMSFLKESTIEIAIPHFYLQFAWWLIDMEDVDREEKKWFTVYKLEQEEVSGHRSCVCAKWEDNVLVKTVTRVLMFDVVMADKVIEKLQQFTKLVFLELVGVEGVHELNLKGLSSLRVMKVKECKNLKKIDSRCSRLKLKYCHMIPRSSTRCLDEVRFVQLVDLPSLESVSFATHCSNLESLWIYDCLALVELPDLTKCKNLKRLVLPPKAYPGILTEELKELTELVFQRRHEVFKLGSFFPRHFLTSIIQCTTLKVLDIGNGRHVDIEYIDSNGYIGSIRVGLLTQLTILDLSGAKMTKIEELCELRHLVALGLNGCSELLELPDLDIFTKLRRLCISQCHKLANTFPKEKVPHGMKNFHALGDKCNFYDHECLNPAWRRKLQRM